MTTIGQQPPPLPGTIDVLIVDDSAVVRMLLTRELSRDPQIRVVGTAADPFAARDKIVQLRPHVMTLDVEMPRMDGITFLRQLMAVHPVPTIVVSSLTAHGTQRAIDALAAGAIDVLAKPGGPMSVDGIGQRLIELVKVAAASRVRAEESGEALPHGNPTRDCAADYAADASQLAARSGRSIIALGASTGGVQALTQVLTQFPADAPGTVVVQHMPAKFTRSFADRLCSVCAVGVAEAVAGELIRPGRVLIAPGGSHLTVRRLGSEYVVDLSDAPAVHHQRPAVDVLFQSIASCAGADAVGALLTGMGSDGAAGLLAMRRAGARTIAQDEATCVVYGMPGEAIKIGAAERVLPLSQIARQVLLMSQWVSRVAS